MSALLRKDLFRAPMRPTSGTDENRLRHRWRHRAAPGNKSPTNKKQNKQNQFLRKSFILIHVRYITEIAYFCTLINKA